MRLGIVWCLFPDETHNADGRHIAYLDAAEFQTLDDALIAVLRAIVETRTRRISSICSSGILPLGSISCDEPILPRHRCPGSDRLSFRSAWLVRCLELTGACDLVFFDPDNGLETTSIPKHHAKAGKYIYWDELALFWRRGQSLLVYHHLNRSASAANQVQTLRHHFTEAFDGASILPLVFRRGSSRVFWLVHRGDEIGRELERRVSDFLDSGWSQHFRPLGWPSDDQANTGAG